MLYRFNLDLAIPSNVFDSISDAKIKAFRDAIRDIKAYAVKINEGKDNEEMTVRAVFHKCYHDENANKPCEPEQEI